MDAEKYTSGKLYIVFEWIYKLIVWNLLTLLITGCFAAVPIGIACGIDKKNEIKDSRVEEDCNGFSRIIITQRNKKETSLPRLISGKITKVEPYREQLKLTVETVEKQESRMVTIPKRITTEDLEGKRLEISAKTLIINDESVAEMQFQECKRKNEEAIAVYQTDKGNVEINYGEKLDPTSPWFSGLIFTGCILGFFVFIPCFITLFTMIKIFREDGEAETFGLFFNRLLDNFRSIYKTELIFVSLFCLLLFGFKTYYDVLKNPSDLSPTERFFMTMAYNLILVSLLILTFFFVNLPLTLGYFRMKTKTIVKFTFTMTFKNILYSFLYLALLFAPVFLFLLPKFFSSLWFLFGFSGPLLIICLLSEKKYRQLTHDFKSYKEDEIYDLKGDNDENGN